MANPNAPAQRPNVEHHEAVVYNATLEEMDEGQKEIMVTPRVASWNRVYGWLREMDGLRQALAA